MERKINKRLKRKMKRRIREITIKIKNDLNYLFKTPNVKASMLIFVIWIFSSFLNSDNFELKKNDKN